MLLLGLSTLHSMQIKHVEACSDSLMMVQQVAGESQCLDGLLCACLDDCLDMISKFVEFKIRHISRHENQKANMLAQHASGFDVGGRNFHIQEKPMHEDINFSVHVQTTGSIDCYSRPSQFPCDQHGHFA